MKFRWFILLGTCALFFSCQTTPRRDDKSTSGTSYKTPLYKDLIGVWKFENSRCSDGARPKGQANVTGEVEFQAKKVIFNFVDAKKPAQPERLEINYFVLQDNLFSYQLQHGNSTSELRLLNDGRLIVRSPIIGLEGDCTSKTALMEITYSRK